VEKSDRIFSPHAEQVNGGCGRMAGKNSFSLLDVRSGMIDSSNRAIDKAMQYKRGDRHVTYKMKTTYESLHEVC
jgi:hypothetical protein